MGQAQRRPTILLSAAAVSLLLFAGLTAVYFANPHRPGQSSGGSGSLITDRSSADESLSALDWNAAADEITTLSADIDALDENAGRLWDRQPAPPSGAANLEPMP